MKNEINIAIEKLFNTEKSEDPTSKEFMLESFETSDNVCANIFEKTPSDLIEEFILSHYIERLKNV